MFNFFGSKKKVKPIEITSQNFNELVYNSDKPVVIDFYATWCQPCQVMISLMNRMSKEEDLQEKITLGVTDIDKNPELARHFGIKSVPTLIFIHNQKVYERQNGLLPYPILKSKIEDFAMSVKNE
ncbi:MAG: thioredoxin domain-containing protein [Flavobacteriaceae bacterium]|nr:thioredoxin domain-containing protein [Flavobacteriaceae bacterium]